MNNLVWAGKVLAHNYQLAGQWIKGYSAGGSRNSSGYSTNPKYCLKVSERGEVIVSLLQHKVQMNKHAHMPFKEHQHYQAIALHMWKVCIINKI